MINGHCPYCKEAIHWCVDSEGTTVALNVVPTENGEFALLGGFAVDATDNFFRSSYLGCLYDDHMATCPNRHDLRKTR